VIRRDENDRMYELWAATRPFAIWVYLGALAFPALVGGLWRLRQVRRHRGAPERELSRHELAYLHGGPREVVLAAIRRLRRTRALAVTNRGLVHAVEPRRRLPDRIDNTIVTNADFVFPKVFAKSLRRVLRPIVKRLEDDGLLVRNRDVRRRVGTVAVLQIGVSVAFLALVVVAGVLRELMVVELLFLGCAVLVLVMTVRRYRPGVPEPTLRGEAHLVDAGLRPPPRSGLRRFLALFTLFAVFLRSSVTVPDEDDPDEWAQDWPDTDSAWGDGTGDGGGDGSDGGGGDGGGES
jgi:uncharacterized protein (TIGR04222 family)